MTEHSFSRVTSIDIHGEMPGEIPLTTWHRIVVYRSDYGGVVTYSVHYDITHFHIADEVLVNDFTSADQFDFEDGSEADAKFQRLALKAFSTTMANRNHSY